MKAKSEKRKARSERWDIYVLLIALFFIFGCQLQQPLRAQQKFTYKVVPFASGNDTLGAIDAVDTVKWQGRHPDLNWPATWIAFEDLITASIKENEQSVNYILTNEAEWGWYYEVRFMIITPAGPDTLISDVVKIADRYGDLTFSVQPDTISSPQDSTLYKTRLGGQ